MYCRKCGVEIESDSLFCKYCGSKTVIIEDVFIKERKIKEKKELSMTWFNILTRYLLPLWIATSGLMLIIYVNTNMTLFIIESLLLIVLFSAYQELKKHTLKGYEYIIVYLTTRLVYPLLYMVIAVYYETGILPQITSLVMSSLIICIPNIIYLKRRKAIFSTFPSLSQ